MRMFPRHRASVRGRIGSGKHTAKKPNLLDATVGRMPRYEVAFAVQLMDHRASKMSILCCGNGLNQAGASRGGIVLRRNIVLRCAIGVETTTTKTYAVE